MDNDAARERLGDVLAGLRDQLADYAELQKKQAALQIDAEVAEGTVVVTVNAQGQLVKTLIDNSFLDDHDFDDLGDYITEAAQTAAKDAGRRIREMLAPINERHATFPSLSDIVEGMPDPSDLMPPGLDDFSPTRQPQQDAAVSSTGGLSEDGDDGTGFVTVRR